MKNEVQYYRSTLTLVLCVYRLFDVKCSRVIVMPVYTPADHSPLRRRPSYLSVLVSESDILSSQRYPGMKIEDPFQKHLFIVTEFVDSHCA